jgi:membrane-associated phospholipid phosphatase
MRKRKWGILWCLASVAIALAFGVPTSHDLVFVWVASGLAAFAAGDIRRRLPGFVLDWLPFMAILFVYDRLRGIADGLVFPQHAIPQIRVEAFLFGKPVPTVWLQQHLWHGGAHLHWWDYAVWFVYLTHFFATLGVAGVLWLKAHDRFSRYATMVCVLAATGFATYVLYPAVPPWLAAREGHIGEANRIIGVVWPKVPLAHYGSLFEKGQSYANNVAAMPSLHAAYALLISLYLWRLVPRRWRPLLFLYPFAMAFSLVYTGEHYVVDILAGWVYATFSFVSVQAWFAWREARARKRVDAYEPEPVYAD